MCLTLECTVCATWMMDGNWLHSVPFAFAAGIAFLRGFQVSLQALGGSSVACQLFLFNRNLSLPASHAQRVGYFGLGFFFLSSMLLLTTHFLSQTLRLLTVLPHRNVYSSFSVGINNNMISLNKCLFWINEHILNLSPQVRHRSGQYLLVSRVQIMTWWFWNPFGWDHSDIIL